MIISASRRTDIPAFYAEWLYNRLKAGFTLVPNPYNAGNVSRVDLTPDNVDAIVFWTKNPAPLFKYLDRIDDLGFNYYFQFTLNGYPEVLEPGVPRYGEIISTFRKLCDSIGPEKIVWRFDPIVVSSVTPGDYVVELFEKISGDLDGYTSRVVISFVDYYRKVRRSMEELSRRRNVTFADLGREEKLVSNIASGISRAAAAHSLEIFSCAEEYDLSAWGIKNGKCIDDRLIERLFGIRLDVAKDRSQRKECGCVQSRDIGQYDSCVHGCIYCYANSGGEVSHKRYSSYRVSDTSLLPNHQGSGEIEETRSQGFPEVF